MGSLNGSGDGQGGVSDGWGNDLRGTEGNGGGCGEVPDWGGGISGLSDGDGEQYQPGYGSGAWD